MHITADTPSNQSPTSAPIAVDLFCGAGGFSLGLQRAGFDVVFAIDSWDKAVKSYNLNFNHPCIKVDVTELTGDQVRSISGLGKQEVDLVVGGPPCQGFSIQRIGSDSDSRNNLVLQYARLLKELNPRMFVLENVPGLLGKRGRPLLDEFLASMTEAGYETEAHIVNAAEYGVPQIRKRVIVVGWRQKDVSPFILPQPTHSSVNIRTVQDAIGDLPIPSEVRESNSDQLHKKTRMSPLNLERLRHIPPGGGMEHLPVNLRVNCHKEGAGKIGHRFVYGRLAPDRPSSTITARFDSFTRGRFAHPTQDRNITLREGARLQTFPDDFQFVGNQEEITAQIGNAVPPVLAEALSRAIRCHLCGETAESSSLRKKARPRVKTTTQVGLFDVGELE